MGKAKVDGKHGSKHSTCNRGTANDCLGPWGQPFCTGRKDLKAKRDGMPMRVARGAISTSEIDIPIGNDLLMQQPNK